MEEMGHMRTRTSWLAMLLTAGVTLAPTLVRGQDAQPPFTEQVLPVPAPQVRQPSSEAKDRIAEPTSAQAPESYTITDASAMEALDQATFPPYRIVRFQEVPALTDPTYPLPLGHDRMEKGGFFAAAEFLYWRQTNPLQHQIIAVRGLLDFDGSITADLNGTVVNPPGGGPPVIIPGPRMPGTFLGSGNPALIADQAKGPLSYEPGWRLTAGWRFQDGLAVEFSWLTLVEAKYAAVATLIPPGLQAGQLLLETFLFSPVFNFPNDYAGPAQKVALGNPFAAFGIWNGATIETIEFIQRFQEYDLTARVPIFQTDYCRCYGLTGFRHVDMWERFRWRTVAQDFNGVAGQDDVALFNNIVSNQMYGPTVGAGSEVYCGHGFSFSLDLRAAVMMDFVHEIVKFERADFSTEAKRGKKDYSVVPELDAILNVWWYPIEGVQIRVGYSFMNFFNTISSPAPVDFDFSRLDPGFSRTYRYFEGFNAGIGFIF
jgi:hypothetical protein